MDTYHILANQDRDVNYQLNDECISTIKGTTAQITITLPYSISGSTSITYSIGNYISSAPTWATINSVSGVLTITAPEVASDTEYDFYINSAISGFPSPFQKLIKLTISANGSSSSSSNSSNTGSSSPNSSNPSTKNSKDESEIAHALSTLIISVTITIVIIVSICSLIKFSTISIVWLLINQLQLLFLLLLTGAFIPKDVEIVILGPDFAFNFYQYFPFENISLYASIFRKFEFELTKSTLQTLGYNYSSTLANTKSLLACTILITIFSFCVYLFRLLLISLRENQNCECITKPFYWITNKIYRMLVFSYFIRNGFEMSQFLLISTINEVYDGNTNDSYRSISFGISILIILLYVLMLFFIILLIVSSYKINEQEHNKLEEIFRGLQQNKKRRSNVVMNFFRRILFILLLIILSSNSFLTLIIILSVAQVIYIICLASLRSYEETKCNLIEILNEIYFGTLILFLAFINTENDWSSVLTKIYMWTIASNTFVTFVIVIGYIIKESIQWLRNCIRRKNIRNNIDKNIPARHEIRVIKNLNPRMKLGRIHPEQQTRFSSKSLVEESKEDLNINKKEGYSRISRDWKNILYKSEYNQ